MIRWMSFFKCRLSLRIIIIFTLLINFLYSNWSSPPSSPSSPSTLPTPSSSQLFLREGKASLRKFTKSLYGPEFTSYFWQVNPSSLEHWEWSISCWFFLFKVLFFQATSNSGLYKSFLKTWEVLGEVLSFISYFKNQPLVCFLFLMEKKKKPMHLTKCILNTSPFPSRPFLKGDGCCSSGIRISGHTVSSMWPNPGSVVGIGGLCIVCSTIILMRVQQTSLSQKMVALACLSGVGVGACLCGAMVRSNRLAHGLYLRWGMWVKKG